MGDGGITEPVPQPMKKLTRMEYLVWSALEPELETHIKLDLNDTAECLAFRDMVERVTVSIIADLTS